MYVQCRCVTVCNADADACVVFVQLGYTALRYACAEGRLEVAQWLVSSAGSNAATERDSV
jgi:hypothetical protein